MHTTPSVFDEASAGSVQLRTPAKLNLYLELLGRRDDGFHEIETLMAPVSLYDTLSFAPRTEGEIELECDRFSELHGAAVPGIERLPEGSDNIVMRAVRLLRQRAGVAYGASIRLVKRIPIAAGLAGGSSDAAAALTAANAAWNLEWSVERLADVAAAVGSDVPFFLTRGPAVCRGRGERIERIDGLGTLHFVVVVPPGGLSTASVYEAYRPAGDRFLLSPLLKALRAGDLESAGRCLRNRLEAPARRLSPYVENVKQEFDKLDVVGHQVTGSGSGYFGLCRHARHAHRIMRRLESTGVGRCYVVRSTC